MVVFGIAAPIVTGIRYADQTGSWGCQPLFITLDYTPLPCSFSSLRSRLLMFLHFASARSACLRDFIASRLASAISASAFRIEYGYDDHRA